MRKEMEKGIDKGWMDAVREQCLSDEVPLSPGSWTQIGRKMRRAAALRRSALAAAILLPAVALLVWSPWRQAATQPVGPAPQLAVSSESVPPEPLAPLRSESLVAMNPSASHHSTSFRPAPSAVIPDLTGESSVPSPTSPSSNTVQIEDEIPEKAIPSSKTAPDEDEVSDGVLWVQADPEPRTRHGISLGLRAGSGPTRRASAVSMQSAPYLAALTFLNTIDPSRMPSVKSNYKNTKEIGAAANAFFPESAAGRYAHDLPLSLGLSLRMSLTPRLGLESGLEYTYLHSVEEFAGSRLNQRLHFIGIPVRLDASLWTDGGFGIYAGLGGKVEKCVSATLGRVVCEEPRLQWSAETFGGIRYQIRPRMQLYFQPALTWYLTKTDLVTYRTEHPLGLSLHAGLRFDL